MSYVLVSSLAALAAAGYGFARLHSHSSLPLEPGELLAESRRRLGEVFAAADDLELRLTAGTAGNVALRQEAGQARDALQELRGALDVVGASDEALLEDPELRRLLADLYHAIEAVAVTIHRLRQQVRTAAGDPP